MKTTDPTSAAGLRPARVLFVALLAAAQVNAAVLQTVHDAVQNNPITSKLRDLSTGAQAYEKNQIGMTHDEGNDAFMDFTVSIMVPLSKPRPARSLKDWHWQAFGAATFRSGQHIFSRTSSPVVTKRFNPLVGVTFHRQDADKVGFFDIVYGHESNGRAIDNPVSFEEVKATYLKVEKDDAKAYRIARDDISRGWDYLGLRYEWHKEKWSFASTARVYFSNSIPQGKKEEYAAWENDPEGKPRQRVDGFTLSGTRRWQMLDGTATYTTGLQRMFRHNTVKLELGLRLSTYARVFLWRRTGYNSDLIHYYKRSSSSGLAISLWDPVWTRRKSAPAE